MPLSTAELLHSSAVLVEALLLCCRFPAIYVLKYQNMRNDKFKELREELKDSSK